MKFADEKASASHFDAWDRNKRRVPCGVVYAALQGVLAGLLAVRLWNYFG
jgi:hypothetical protein